MSQIEPASSLPKSRVSGMSTLASVPPWSLVLFSTVSVQLGAAVAKQLFETVGPSGVVLLRTLLAGILFFVLWRPQIRGYSRQVYIYISLYGVVIALNMLLFYATIDRIPLGVAVAIAFAGPLGVAVWGSRRVADLAWVVLAAIGILLLSPLTDVTLDPFGVVLAFLTAVMWAAYIVLTKRVGRVVQGNIVLTLGMGVAALVALPFGMSGALHIFADPALIILALVAALLSSAIPFALEFRAMQQLSSFTVSLLLSLEPVAATVIGTVILHEALDLRELAGIILVTIAAIGTTWVSR